MTPIQTHCFYLLIMGVAFSFVCLSDCIRVNTNSSQYLSERRESIVPVVFSFFVLFFPAVLRTCGTDTAQYYKTYRSDDVEGLDRSFYVLCKFLHGIIPKPQIGLGIITAFTLILIVVSFFRIRQLIDFKYAFLAFLLSMYFYLYNYMRIMLAVSFIMIAYSCIVSDNKKTAFLFFTIAIMFHRSAAIVLLVYIAVLCFSRAQKFVVTCITIGTAAFVANPSFFLGMVTAERYSSQLNMNNISSSAIGLGTTVRMIPFLIILYAYRQYKSEKVYGAALVFTLANIAFSLLGYYASSASRISNMYFVFHLVFFLPWLIKKESFDIRSRKILVLFTVLYSLYNYYILTLNFDAMGIIPYK